MGLTAGFLFNQNAETPLHGNVIPFINNFFGEKKMLYLLIVIIVMALLAAYIYVGVAVMLVEFIVEIIFESFFCLKKQRRSEYNLLSILTWPRLVCGR